ncbi:MAG: DUF2480 family protein [candidate division Zixibacteria bacterium]|nr:DUF2480 family protein [candidate division Zixibacteria bacterium]
MTYETVDPKDFLTDGIFREDDFIAKVNELEWSKFDGKMVLVRGCSTIMPPWVYMLLTSKLMPFAKSIRYGNEHDNLVVHRSQRTAETKKT